MPACLTLAFVLMVADAKPAAPATSDSAPSVAVPTLHLSFAAPPADDAKLGLVAAGVTAGRFTAGDIADDANSAKRPTANRGSAEFDGVTSLIQISETPASAAAFTSGDFTWEGFFFWPGSNQIDVDKAVSDRFITQFKNGKSGSTRLTLGLSRAKAGDPVYLAIATAGETGRHLGNREVSPDVWHHFALVVHGDMATWYLDYLPCGETTFDDQSPATTLAPLGASPVAVGGRNMTGGKVDRGFAGLLDELRITPRALAPADFLRSRQTNPEKLVQVDFVYPLAEPIDWLDLASAEPTESLVQESLGIVGTPQPFSMGGYAEARRGNWGVRTTRDLSLPAGRYQLLVRTSVAAVLDVDGRTLVDARPPVGHPLSPLPVAMRDYAVEFDADGRSHRFRLTGVVRYDAEVKKPSTADAEPIAADAALRAAQLTNDVIVGFAPLDAKTGLPGAWRMLGSDELPLDDFTWSASRGRTHAHWTSLDDSRRASAVARREDFWRRRHAWAGEAAAKWDVPPVPSRSVSGQSDSASRAQTATTQPGNPIDAFLAAKMQSLSVRPGPTVDDATYLRRVTLDLVGRNPTYAEARAFYDDASADRRERLVDRLLASPDWADAWVGYWQDLLAENPSILKATLNNSGPFRRWIHESFAANKPMDRFAAELILMQGGDDQGGPAGFAISAGNDLPMAMKGHVVAQAFLGIDMKCARCHDAPYAPLEQADLFGLAAMLDEKTLTVPAASTVTVPPGARPPEVSSSLKAGDKIAPQWPLEQMIPAKAAEEGVSIAELVDRPRARLAAIVTSPSRTRFSDVLVNRVWQRYFAVGLVDPVDHWMDRSESSHPELLAYLSREFVVGGYDMKRLVRQIVTSEAYARAVGPAHPIDASQRTFAWQSRRRLSAEQVVDSLFAAVGKPLNTEELNMDPRGTRGFITLPAPQKSWQFASLANERDRPALALPVNQMIIDVLTTFGWRETRPDPWTRQDAEPNPLQPLMLGNGTITNHAVRLTEDNLVTEWCLEDVSLAELVDRLFLTTVSRKPDEVERELISQVLAEGYAERRTGKPKPPPVVRIRAQVDWDKHLQGEASVELMEAEKQARAGDPPTVRLSADFRRRVEDVMWSLVNSPEFVFVP